MTIDEAPMDARLVSSIRLGLTGAGVLLASVVLAPGIEAQTARPPESSSERDRDTPKKKQDDDLGFRWKGYPSLQLGKGTHIDLRARFQFDARWSHSPAGDTEPGESDVARRRISVEGEIRNVVAFEIDAELDGERTWRDAYANYQQFGAVQVQGGHFKLPFSMDENTSATNLDFVYRSLAARALAPGRDRGVMLHGRVLDRVLRYELGIFDQDGRNARTRNPERVSGSRTFETRVVAQPFRNSKSITSDLQAGAAFTSSDVGVGVRSLRGLTTFEDTFFDPDLWVQGRRQRNGVEVRWRPGPFSLKSEYVRVTTERRGQSVEDTDLSPLVATGWYVSGTWAITGEKKSAGLNKPRRPFLRGGLGAFETAIRVERLTFASRGTDGIASFSPRADVIETASNRVTTIGGNWYLNPWVKIQLNAVREAVTSPRRGTPESSRARWFYVTRFQFTM
jgi:phosphate-selective porin OprO and OprP